MQMQIVGPNCSPRRIKETRIGMASVFSLEPPNRSASGLRQPSESAFLKVPSCLRRPKYDSKRSVSDLRTRTTLQNDPFEDVVRVRGVKTINFGPSYAYDGPE